MVGINEAVGITFAATATTTFIITVSVCSAIVYCIIKKRVTYNATNQAAVPPSYSTELK